MIMTKAYFLILPAVKGPVHLLYFFLSESPITYWCVAHMFWALLTSSRSLWELLFSSGGFWREEKKKLRGCVIEREKQIFERGFECRFSGQPWQNFSFPEIRPLDCSEIFTPGSQHIALHLDGSDRQSKLLIVCYCSWCNLHFLGDISQFLFSFVLALMYVVVGGLWHLCRLIWVSLPSICIIR